MKLKIIRKIDKLGRIVIPKDLRKALSLTFDTEVEITVENGTIILKKG